MNHLLKNTTKFAIGTCFTLGAVAVAASVVVGSNVGKLVAAGFNGAKSAVEEELTKLKTDASSMEENTMFANTEETAVEKVEVSPADFEN